MSMRKKIGLAAISLAFLATPALAGSVDFYHDKANWQDAFTKVLAKEVGGHGITVNAIAPYGTLPDDREEGAGSISSLPEQTI